MIKDKPKVIIYCDGACSGNPGPGGWGAILIANGIEKELYGYSLDTTNNIMELTAAIESIKALKKPCIVDIYTDSKYVQVGITEWVTNWEKNNWKKKDNKEIKNLLLWKELVEVEKNHTIKWNWVKGHSSNLYNEKADAIAVKAKKIAQQINDKTSL